MAESGIILGIWQKHKAMEPSCISTQKEPLGMDSLLGIFLIFIIGFGLALIILLFEYLKKKFSKLSFLQFFDKSH